MLCDGQPAAAITAITQDGGDYTIMPLFVTPTPGMILTDHHGREPGSQDR